MIASVLDVVIAGGGIAGLEALLALREWAGDRVRVTLVAPSPQFTYWPPVPDRRFGRASLGRRMRETRSR